MNDDEKLPCDYTTDELLDILGVDCDWAAAEVRERIAVDREVADGMQKALAGYITACGGKCQEALTEAVRPVREMFQRITAEHKAKNA